MRNINVKQKLVPRQTCSEGGHSAAADGIRAAVADPTWFLERQWALGEFECGHGGQPIQAMITYVDEPLTQIGWGDDPDFEDIADPEIPLDAVAEGGSNSAKGFTVDDLPPGGAQPGAGATAKARGWIAEHLEYRFAIRSSSSFADATLHAPRHTGTHLDWYSFTTGRLDISGTGTALTLVPRTVELPGMPNPRWWEFEDEKLDLGNLLRPNLDVLAMLLVEFAALYSADWYVIPVPQAVNTLRSIRSVVVVDSFGVSDTIPAHEPAGAESFSMFTLGKESSRFHLLLNAKANASEGDPIETVIFFPDESANVVWAIEDTYYGKPSGQSDGFQRFRPGDEPPPPSPSGAAAPAPQGALLRYHAMASVPEHFIPYVPVPVKVGQMKLRRARTVDRPDDPTFRQYKTGIVADSKWIAEEELFQTSVAVTERVQAVAVGRERWQLTGEPGSQKLERQDPKRYVLWLGRKTHPGNARERVNWVFDVIE
jgi:hypothetical protein